MASWTTCHPELRDGPWFSPPSWLSAVPANTNFPRVARDDSTAGVCLETIRRVVHVKILSPPGNSFHVRCRHPPEGRRPLLHRAGFDGGWEAGRGGRGLPGIAGCRSGL